MLVPAQQLVLDESDVVLLERLRLFHIFGKLHSLHQCADIIGVVEVVGVNNWRVMDTGTSKGHRTPTLGPEQRRYEAECLGEGMILVEVGPDGAVPAEHVPQIGSPVDSKVERTHVKLQV